MAQGRLVLHGKSKSRCVVFATAKGESPPIPIPPQELHPALAKLGDAEWSGLAVELEVDGGRPRRVRPVGATFTAQAPPPPPPRSDDRRGRPPGAQGRPTSAAPVDVGPERFHNPYNVIPAPARKQKGELADRPPVGHDAHVEGYFSGRVRVRLAVETPLLLPDAAAVSEDPRTHHKTFPVRLAADGSPYLAPTSVKGMLRSAFEAITNSRFGVFAGHEERLAYRMVAQEGLAVVPARIDGNSVVLLTGTSRIGSDGKAAPGDPLYAAWLEKYTPRRPNWGGLDQHGKEVWAYITPWKHQRFAFWNVAAMRAATGAPPTDSPKDGRQGGPRSSSVNAAGRWVKGWVCITNRNINNKHDERVFFADGATQKPAPLTKELRAAWETLIANYQATHEDEIAKGQTRPPALNNYCVWSRQIKDRTDLQLADGALVYAEIDPRTHAVKALYPVSISRKLYEAAPAELLDRSLKPAQQRGELSPAERVFGWVNGDGSGAYRSQLRVGPVRCETADAVEHFPPPGVPLAILGQPKPQQGRFYVGDKEGRAPAQGATKVQAGYDKSGKKALRGRKVYPHHAALPADYWARPTEDRTQRQGGGRFQEYRRPSGEKERDDQNRSVLGWVKPGAKLTFDLDVINLSPVELGALAFLLELPAGHFHRLGGGRPLGFGSVRLSIESHALADGKAWRGGYLRLTGEPAWDEGAVKEARQAFEEAVAGAYGKPFDKVSFIAAFLKAASGFADHPTAYPRARKDGERGLPPPRIEGESFKWFVANERQGFQHALPDLVDDRGLPFLPGEAPRR